MTIVPRLGVLSLATQVSRGWGTGVTRLPESCGQFGDCPDPWAIGVWVKVGFVDQNGGDSGGPGTDHIDVIHVADVNGFRCNGSGLPECLFE